MRPRLNAGDDETADGEMAISIDDASMRPRLNAGDDTHTHLILFLCWRCFNEAPAKCRG